MLSIYQHTPSGNNTLLQNVYINPFAQAKRNKTTKKGYLQHCSLLLSQHKACKMTLQPGHLTKLSWNVFK